MYFTILIAYKLMLRAQLESSRHDLLSDHHQMCFSNGQLDLSNILKFSGFQEDHRVNSVILDAVSKTDSERALLKHVGIRPA